ncbi:uncharacterized protein RAG0_14380 [Rhynchosporium agropyri]|uniref:Uncharacterized protein n=1 Tax=Rhynchosporium agropyri TaxID=914238 RepID=A0A1E1LGW1_9HELO|nr:uncharacterized protein RAG0_14380 [Rhynchosporium agropyri]
MVDNTVVIPIAVLSSICVTAFVFTWWWFPRAWAEGDAADREEYEVAKRRRELAEERAVGSEGDTDVELGTTLSGNAGVDAPPRAPAGYVPPVTPY